MGMRNTIVRWDEMIISFTDSNEEFTTVKYNEDEKAFIIESKEKSSQIQCVPSVPVIKEFDPATFEYIILFNERENCSENNIFTVYVPDVESDNNRSRIGWLFPLQALESNEHNYADDEFFQRYAYIAFCLLLNDINDQNRRQFSSEIRLSDFYGDNIHLLIIDHENTSNIKDFNINDYVVSLYMHGYSFEGKGNLISEISYEGKKNLNLKKISPLLYEFSVIPIIFKTTVIREYNAEFSRFYAYYQLIEIFISVVFDEELKNYVSELSANSKKLFDLKDKLNEITNEKKRVVWLINNYSSISSELSTNLKTRAINLLQLNGKKTYNSMAENLYTLRCLLVHELYNVDEQSEVVLGELNDLFLQMILEILKSFKSPYNTPTLE